MRKGLKDFQSQIQNLGEVGSRRQGNAKGRGRVRPAGLVLTSAALPCGPGFPAAQPHARTSFSWEKPRDWELASLKGHIPSCGGK